MELHTVTIEYTPQPGLIAQNAVLVDKILCVIMIFLMTVS